MSAKQQTQWTSRYVGLEEGWVKVRRVCRRLFGGLVGELVRIESIGRKFFFFSSRRRHTRWTGDWSSDVCSSDLQNGATRAGHRGRGEWRRFGGRLNGNQSKPLCPARQGCTAGQDRNIARRRTAVQIGRASCRERV